MKCIPSEDYIGVMSLKDNRKAFITEVEGLFKLQKPQLISKTKKKEIRSWSEILNYKNIPVKVVTFEKRYEEDGEFKTDIIYVASTSLNLKNETINKIIHARWDIENNGFNELKNYWNTKHCFMADEKVIQIILQMITICYNLRELYLYSHLHNFQNMNMPKWVI